MAASAGIINFAIVLPVGIVASAAPWSAGLRSRAKGAANETPIALVLTCQVFVGALLGVAAQAFLAIGVIFYILPWIGLGLLDTARDVADFDLPGKVLAIWWGGS